MVKLKHENGLTISIATDMENKETQDGFIVYPKGGLERRSPIQVVISLGKEQEPQGVWPESKSIGGAMVYYRESMQSGGSGGTEYTLETWKSCAGGHIKTEQLVQTERGDPDFSLTWLVISNADRRDL